MIELFQLTAFILPLFLSIILHEMAHGWVALKLGDKTAQNAGRLTFNPLTHVDIVGSIIVPILLFISKTGFLFGWAKPIPVRFDRLHHPKKDMGLVALAGPLTNFVLAMICVFVLKTFFMQGLKTLAMQWIAMNLVCGVIINVSLCVFNLLPLLPLDGGRILVSLLPMKWSVAFSKTERYGFFVLLILLLVLPLLGEKIGQDFDVIRWYMNWMVGDILSLIQLT